MFDQAKKINPGDRITAMGYTFDVWTILYQDYFGDQADAPTGSDWYGHDIEFLDSAGRYHHWKQNQDGGQVIRDGIPGDYFRDDDNDDHIAAVREARRPGTYTARIIHRDGAEEYLGRFQSREAAADRIRTRGQDDGITWKRM